MKHFQLDVLYEDNHLMVVNKPAGLATMGVSADKASLLTLAKDYVKNRYHKPGNVYLGILSRLDAPVTGVVLLARTSKAARRLTEQFREREVEKVYWALVEGTIHPAQGMCENWLGPDERHRRMHVVGPTLSGAQHARLSYRRLTSSQGVSLLEVILETGRKHQIRLQLAERGHPILGDRKYGSARPWPAGIALHARRLTVQHPVGGASLTFEAPPPAAWNDFELPN
ncbi:MAG TPA: RluA family pseudouridine synthase [Thermoguttaceae bacterium]|nr:RluA family pseudouridine synthase [Thermoguttaceae bacterium]